jgi:hypothetical protein
MNVRKLETVPYRPNGAKATVIDCQPGFTGPYFRGEGDTSLVCGACSHVLVNGEVEALLTLYLCCPQCGTYNRHDGMTRGALGVA